MNHNNRKLIENRQYVQGKIIIGISENKSDSKGEVCLSGSRLSGHLTY